MIKSSIFKSYDVRGIYPDQLNENTAFQVGRAFIKHTGVKKVVIGYDARISSPQLFKALSEGIISQGADIYSIGQVSTECVYFSVGYYDFDAGIMVTASHNPKEYNGFKMITKKGDDIEVVRGKDLLSTVNVEFEEKEHGKIYEKDILQDYINHILKFKKENIKPFKVVIDASNGVVGKFIDKIESSLPIEIIKLNFKPDGNFPNHSPNPLEEGAADQIKKEINQNKADFGIMFDGDADRIFLVDENGDILSSDVTRLLIAKYILQDYPGAVIVNDLICSKAVPEFIEKWGGKSLKAPVGFVNIREMLLKNNGVFGAEVSGHYSFKDYFYMDSGMIAFLTLLKIISDEKKNISQIAKDLSPYFKDPVINFEIEDKESVMERVKEKYSDGKQDNLDGITVEYTDWWFNLRPSNTEPLLKLTLEANTNDLLEQKKKELSELIVK